MPRGYGKDPTYRPKCRKVALADGILSCISLGLSFIMLFKALQGRGDHPDLEELVEADGYFRKDTLWVGRIVGEVISILLAAKLLQSTNLSVVEETPKVACKWCEIWLVGCSTWIILIFIGVVLIIVETVESKEYYVEIALLSLIIVIRMVAAYVVLRYRKELKEWLNQERFNDVKA